LAIAAASNHSAAVTAQGTVWAWGQNEAGALGADDEALERSDVPMRVGQAVPAETPIPSLLRRIFSPCGLDALQNRKAQQYNCTHRDPMGRDMQNHGPINQPADQDQEADDVYPE